MYPALAVVNALGKRAEILWVGSEDGMEAALVNRAGLTFRSIQAGGIHGVGFSSLPRNLTRLARGIAMARQEIRRFQPDALFFTGGFVGVPVAVAGWRLPKSVFVPDIEPAMALRLIGHLSDVITVSTDISRSYYAPGRNIVVTGYPTRHELSTVEREDARTRLGLDQKRPVVLVFGGSRGARSINHALWGCLANLLEKVQVVHITGELDWSRVEGIRKSLPEGVLEAYHPYAYLHEEMPFALAAADLVVSRAGAATLGEYPILGLPAVLVPYPHAWRYQKVNAEYLVSRGAAVQLDDGGMASTLLPTVLGLVDDPTRLSDMAAAARKLAAPGAARAIADEIIDLVETKGGTRG